MKTRIKKLWNYFCFINKEVIKSNFSISEIKRLDNFSVPATKQDSGTFCI